VNVPFRRCAIGDNFSLIVDVEGVEYKAFRARKDEVAYCNNVVIFPKEWVAADSAFT